MIIPYNKPIRYLESCLESIKDEDLKDFETILILNGVEEDKEKLDDLIQNYQNDLNMKIKTFDDEIGVAKARNEGMNLATGEYIYFIDSDDYLHKNGLKKLVDIAMETNADFINGNRFKTYFIKDRFDEELEKRGYDEQENAEINYTDLYNSIQLLVSPKKREPELLTALHSLIKRSIVTENNIKFDESKKFFSDYSFMINVIDKSQNFKFSYDAIYAKKLRGDKINAPSLNQEADINLFIYSIDEYENIIPLIEKIDDKEKIDLLKFHITNKLVKYYRVYFSRQYRADIEKEWRTTYFDKFSEISKTFNLKDIEFKYRREIKALQNHDRKNLEKYMNIRLAIRKGINLIKDFKIDKIFRTIYLNKYNKEPIVENRIFFIAFRGDFYTDSPKNIYEYLLEKYRDKYEYVWVINDNKTKIPGNPIRVKRFSLKYYKYIATSKYWVSNGRQALRLRKRPEQIMLSTWHGTPLKRLGLDIDNIYSGSPKIKKSYIENAKGWNYLVSPNSYTTEILRRAFGYKGEILEEGYPRNDILYNASEETVNKIKEDLKLPKDKKIIIYAPTWRDDEFYDIGQYKFALKLDLDKMKEELSDEYILLIRTHYFIADRLDLSDYKGFAYDVSKYDDIAELYLISDILITDYSSVFFDFANLKRPILFFTYDLDKYEQVLRGFYIDINEEVPGPLLFTSEEVIDAIKNIEEVEDEYKDKYDIFYDRFCSIDDGNATERIVNRVWK